MLKKLVLFSAVFSMAGFGYAGNLGGWADPGFDYSYEANAPLVGAGTVDPAMRLDGTWHRGRGSDEWGGDTLGAANPCPGGMEIVTVLGESALRIVDAGDPRGSCHGDPGSNRKMCSGHDLEDELGAGYTGSILDDGVTFVFRMRVVDSSELDAYDVGGADPLDYTFQGSGKGGPVYIASRAGGNKMLNFTILGGHLLGAATGETTAAIDIDLAPASINDWLTVWVTCEAGTTGNLVKVWLNGNVGAPDFEGDIALPSQSESLRLPDDSDDYDALNYMVVELEQTGGIGAFDFDCVAYKAGAVAPAPGEIVLIDEDFTSDPSANWQLNGNAVWDAANARVLVVPAENNQAGTMFFKTPLLIDSFRLEATVEISGGTGADGMGITFIEGDETFATKVGGGGGGMCITNLTAGKQIAVEFDIWGNGEPCESCPAETNTGQAGNHIGVEYSPIGFPQPAGTAADCVPNDGGTNSACAGTGDIGFDLWGDYTFELVVQVVGALVTVDIGSQDLGVAMHRVMTKEFTDYASFSGLFGMGASTGGANANHIIHRVKLSSLSADECLLPPGQITRNIDPGDTTSTRPLEWDEVAGYELGVAIPVELAVAPRDLPDPCGPPEELTVQEILPAGWTAQNISNEGTFAGGAVTWVLSSIPGAGVTLTYDAVPAETTEIVSFSGGFSETSLPEPDIFTTGGESQLYPLVDDGMDDLGFITSWLTFGPLIINPPLSDGSNPGVENMLLDWLTDGVVSELTLLPQAGDEITPDYSDYVSDPNVLGASPASGLHQTPDRNAFVYNLNPNRAGGTAQWLAWNDRNDTIEYDAVMYGTVDQVMSYAVAYVTNETGSPIACQVGVASDDSIGVVLNGTPIFTISIPRGSGDPQTLQNLVPCVLNPGVNRVMTKVFEGGGGFNFRLRFQTAGGEPIMDGLTVSLDPPAEGCPIPPVEVTRALTVTGTIEVEGVPQAAYTQGSQLAVALSLANVRGEEGGCDPAGDVTISEHLPAGWIATDISDEGTFADGAVTWNLTAAQLSAKAGPVTYNASGPVTGAVMSITGGMVEAGNVLSFGVGGDGSFPTDWPFSSDGYILTWNILGAFDMPADLQGSGSAPGEDNMRQDWLTDGTGITEANIQPIPGLQVNTDFNNAARAGGLKTGAAPGINPDGIPTWVGWRGPSDGNIQYQNANLYNEQDETMCYMACYLEVEADMTVCFGAGSDDSIQVLVDNDEVIIHNEARGWGGGAPQDVSSPYLLTAGVHRLMAKVFEGGVGWNGGVRLQDCDTGAPITTGFRTFIAFNEPPVADAGPDQAVECACNAGGTQVTLDGSGSSDPDGDPLTYTWSGDIAGATATGVNPTVTLEDGCAGTYELTLVVNDGTVDSAPDTVTIIVEDTSAPELTCPPDQSFDRLTGEVPKGDVELPTEATDACDGVVTVTTDAPDVFTEGTTLVTATATDAATNSSTCSFSVTVVIPQSPFVRGEANQSGILDIADAFCILDYLFGPAGAPCKTRVPLCMDAADANDDAGVDVADALYVLQYLFTSGPMPPMPFPLCGPDLTDDDDLRCIEFGPCEQ